MVAGAQFSRSRWGDREILTEFRPRTGNGLPQGERRTFVLVHGIGVSSRYYRPLADELAAHGEVWSVNLPGYGGAAHPSDNPTIDDHADVLARFIADRGIVNPVVVGHSMGCQVVAALAAGEPAITDTVVLIGPTIDEKHRSLAQQALRLALDTLREPWVVNAIVFTDYMLRCGPKYFLAQTKVMLEDRIEERLPRIRARALVLVGESDPIVPRRWATRVTALLPEGRLDYLPGPHIVMYPAAAATAALILSHAALPREVGA